jgi:hypothetical protein
VQQVIAEFNAVAMGSLRLVSEAEATPGFVPIGGHDDSTTTHPASDPIHVVERSSDGAAPGVPGGTTAV